MSTSEHPVRAVAIAAALSPEDRVRMLSGADMWHTVAVPGHGVEAVTVADGPHGIRKQAGDGSVGFGAGEPATCFPPAATLACSWDPALAEAVGRAIGAEARAQGVDVVLGPGLNLKRHPCCGRNFEYYSEDPLLSGRMAAGLVRGVQQAGAGACLKHFAVNNQETARMVVDAIVDERTLRELYLTGFEIAVAEGRPWTVMCAYNRVNGEYCSDSRGLLNDILRGEWGFDGLVMSDWGAVNDRVAGVAAGLDLEMPGSAGVNDATLLAAVAEGRLAADELTTAAGRVVSLALKAQEARSAERPSDMTSLTEEHHALARRAAAESTVLLANDGVLPLRPNVRLAVIGAIAETPRYQGTGSSQVTPTRLDDALTAIRKRAGEGSGVEYVPAYDPVTGASAPDGVSAAALAAVEADVALVFVGLPPAYESEGFDRAHMRLPEAHDRLVEAVCTANPRTVVVLAGGSPAELPWAGRPAAVLATYLGGQAGGSAVADVLFGDAEPAGRLAETWPLVQADVAADAHFPGTGRQVQYREGLYVGYRYFTTAGRPVRYSFGHGLSYTTFEFGEVSLTAARIPADGEVTVRVPVTNTGERRGAAVVQVYVRDVASAVHRPVRELRGFAKLWLEPGETGQAEVTLGARAFAYYDAASASWQTEGGEFEVLVGASADDLRGRATVVVDSAFVPAASPPPPGLVADDVRFAAMLGRAVPGPEAVLPFRRTSTIGDLGHTALGRRLQRALVRTFERRVGTDALDATARAMMERVVSEMPLRSLVTMSEGALSWRVLDALIAVLNGRWGRALVTLVRG